MSIGSYGVRRPADVDVADVEIFYHFRSDRSKEDFNLKKLASEDILSPIYHNTNTTTDTFRVATQVIGGLYNLKLKSEDFSEVGVYSLYIRPKEINTTITDCGVLASLPSVRGLVIDLGNVSDNDKSKFIPQGLVGYRVEYINPTNSTKINNMFRLVTSSFYCVPIASTVTNTNQKSIRYQYSDTPTNYVFLTLTPSSAPSNRPNNLPFIGQPNQNIILSNTMFNPMKIDIEIVEHDASTLAHALYGNQTKAMNSGIYTIYGKDNEIYKQYNLYEVKDKFDETLYEVREEREEIDDSLNFDEITN